LNTVFNVNAITRVKFPKQRLLVLDIIVCTLGHSKTKAAIKFCFWSILVKKDKHLRVGHLRGLQQGGEEKKSVASVH
jgi:hypothetical protein